MTQSPIMTGKMLAQRQGNTSIVGLSVLTSRAEHLRKVPVIFRVRDSYALFWSKRPGIWITRRKRRHYILRIS